MAVGPNLILSDRRIAKSSDHGRHATFRVISFLPLAKAQKLALIKPDKEQTDRGILLTKVGKQLAACERQRAIIGRCINYGATMGQSQ